VTVPVSMKKTITSFMLAAWSEGLDAINRDDYTALNETTASRAA
jgi:hypothetical protein